MISIIISTTIIYIYTFLISTTTTNAAAILPPPFNIDPFSNLHPVQPPWSLKGRGITISTSSSPMAFLPGSGLSLVNPGGMVQFNRYTESDVGPYDEILFVPGTFAFKMINGTIKSDLHISTIFVDSALSALSGRVNWAIPKFLSTFEWEYDAKGRESGCKVFVNDSILIADYKWKNYDGSYDWSLPLPTKIIQEPVADTPNGEIETPPNVYTETQLTLQSFTAYLSEVTSHYGDGVNFPQFPDSAVSKIATSYSHFDLSFSYGEEVQVVI